MCIDVINQKFLPTVDNQFWPVRQKKMKNATIWLKIKNKHKHKHTHTRCLCTAYIFATAAAHSSPFIPLSSLFPLPPLPLWSNCGPLVATSSLHLSIKPRRTHPVLKHHPPPPLLSTSLMPSYATSVPSSRWWRHLSASLLIAIILLLLAIKHAHPQVKEIFTCFILAEMWWAAKTNSLKRQRSAVL